MSIAFEKDQAEKIIARVGKIRGILVPEPSNENGIDGVLCALMEEGYKLHPETIEQFAGETAYSHEACWDFYGLSLKTRVTSGVLIVAVYDNGLSFELDRTINDFEGIVPKDKMDVPLFYVRKYMDSLVYRIDPIFENK
ncbi:MAG: hypothetical protein KKA62_04570 [Nanoarchaeota archaeon]|nr:hypothetical protein [Nanoarchaeota archaeon]MBU1977195.1 hypothetical protein [Nanoarchaeota archaeon]